MLEVKNLAKYYSTKGGVTVKALDDVIVDICNSIWYFCVCNIFPCTKRI